MLVSSGKTGVAETQCSIGNLDPTPSFSAQAPLPNGYWSLQESAPETFGTSDIQGGGFLSPIRLHMSSFRLLASDLVTGWQSLFFLSYSKLDEDRRQHKTTRALGEIPRLRANDILGVQKMLYLVVAGTHTSIHVAQTPP